MIHSLRAYGRQGWLGVASEPNTCRQGSPSLLVCEDGQGRAPVSPSFRLCAGARMTAKSYPRRRDPKELRPCFEAASPTVTPITDTSYYHMLAAIIAMAHGIHHGQPIASLRLDKAEPTESITTTQATYKLAT